MKENYFMIGEVSKIKGITVKALRFYDRIGLLKPSYIDPDSRYRYYHISQFVYLDIIKAARMMDISPNDLIPYFQGKDSAGLIIFLDIHKEKISQRINALGYIISSINEVKKSIHHAETASRDDEVYFRNLPDRFAVAVPFDRNKSADTIVLDYSELYITVSECGYINTYEDGVLFTESDNGEFHPGFLCSFVADVPNGGDDLHMVPGGNYVCINYTQEKAGGQQQKLWDYLQKHKLKPLELVQVGLLTDLVADETELFELQVRV